MQVLSVASELYPILKTGGLADVAGALPAALAVQGIRVRSLLPGHPSVIAALPAAEVAATFDDLFGGPARLVAGKAGGLDLLAIDAPHLFARPGNPYAQPGGQDWPDNAQRFAALAWVAAELGRGLVPGLAPDVIHLHDWQAALAPAYLHYGGGPRPGTVLTIHNLAHQGAFPPDLLAALRLPPDSFGLEGVEYYGGIGFLKAGIRFADRITTVSPSYAREIRSPEGGMGLDGLLRARGAEVTGILNGIDVSVWDPAQDAHLAAHFDALRLAGRSRNKAALQRRFGLAQEPRTLLFGVVSRLSWQKGLDLLLEAMPELTGLGAQLALLGAGDAPLEVAFRQAAAAHAEQVGVVIGYDEGLAHLIQGGSDALLVPSRFEPCGLTQLCALRYGAVPVVAETGGLADTVINANAMALAAEVATGVQFAPVTARALEGAMERTAALWTDPGLWKRMQLNGMKTDVGWTRPARLYADLYRALRPGS
jgi:starch synthase